MLLSNLKRLRAELILEKLTGDSVGARARRAAFWSFADFGGGQALRLVSNLVLTRLLFPEAFGLMALVTVITAGLVLFSDTGVRSLIAQGDRGDDPDFLNTAWTVQIIRSAALWMIAVAIAGPVSELYQEPLIAQILPIAAISLLIEGFTPTSVYTVNRHLALGRYVSIKLGVQTFGLIIMVSLAWYLQSVWALVIGNVLSSALSTIAYLMFLHGLKNRFLFERSAVTHIFHFGKWVFLSTIAGFLVNQGDKAILGLYVSLQELGVYNIGYFLASAPILLSFSLQQTVMIPLYRMRPPAGGAENRAALFKARRLIAISMIVAVGVLGFIGPPLVTLIYDARYESAGPMITLFSISVVPMITLGSITAALIGVGDTKAMFSVVGTTAVCQIGLLFLGISTLGVPGALLSPGLAILASYPLRFVYSLKYRVFDPIQDFGITAIGLLAPIAACFWYYSEIASLFVI